MHLNTYHLLSFLITSTLAAPAPRQHLPQIPTPASAEITVTSSNGARGRFSIPVGYLITSEQVGVRDYAVVAAADTPGVFCRAYSDATGTARVGGAFTDTHRVNFNALRDEYGDLPVLASWCCVGAPSLFHTCESSPSVQLNPRKPR